MIKGCVHIFGIFVWSTLAVTTLHEPVRTEQPDEITSKNISVAVATNFADPIKIIAQNFEDKTGCKVTLAFGSTGRHYAQIQNGAPFEVFLAADTRRPKLLEEEGLAISGSRFTYAIGRLVLWSPQADMVDSMGKVLESLTTDYIAIANPRLAPYGMAAQEVLQARGQWDRLQDRLVRGENIGQAYQFIKSGNAQLGFVAGSQVMRPGEPFEGSMWMIPQNLYSPIEQQAILIKDNPAARAFLEHLRSPETLEIIRAYGYRTPQPEIEEDNAE